jgi:hypothetical protein
LQRFARLPLCLIHIGHQLVGDVVLVRVTSTFDPKADIIRQGQRGVKNMTSRRRFLSQVLGASACAISGSCFAAQTETSRTKRLIVDSQVHIWQPNTPERPWPATAGPPQLPEPFSYERLLALMDQAHVDRVILVPPSWQGIRNDYALEAVAKYPDRFAVMGLVELIRSRDAARAGVAS